MCDGDELDCRALIEHFQGAGRVARRPSMQPRSLSAHPGARPRRRRKRPAEAAPLDSATVDPRILTLTAGRRAVVVGGDCRNHSKASLKRAFEFSELRWDTGLNTRQTAALAQRVASGKVDLLLFIRRFMSHSVGDLLIGPAKRSGTAMAWVDQGYGVRGVELALRRYLLGERASGG